MLALGQTGSGKTYTLFGGGDGSVASEGIVMQMLEALFDRIDHAREPSDYSVALSIWEVRLVACRMSVVF